MKPARGATESRARWRLQGWRRRSTGKRSSDHPSGDQMSHDSDSVPAALALRQSFLRVPNSDREFAPAQPVHAQLLHDFGGVCHAVLSNAYLFCSPARQCPQAIVRVGDAHGRKNPSECACRMQQEAASERHVDGAAKEPGSECRIDSSCEDRLNQPWDVGGVVLTIPVESDDHVGAAIKCEGKTCAERGT